MQLTIQRIDLDRAIKAVQRAVPSRAPLPILCNVMIKASGEVLTVVGNDLEISLTAVAVASVGRAGETLINSKTLGDIVGKLPDGAVTIEADGSDAHIKAGRSKFKLRVLRPEDYPAPPAPGDDDETTVFDAQSLLAGLRHVVYAAAPEEKAVICGILIEQDADGVTLVATDGFRLARYTLPGSGGDPWSIVVPRRAVEEMVKALDKVDGDVVLHRTAQQIILSAGTRTLTARLIDGVFPNYRQIIPAEFQRTATVNRTAMLAAVERVAVLSTDREAHAMAFDFKDGELAIESGSSELGSADEAVAITLEGEPLRISLNASLLSDMIKATEGESLVLQMNGALAPMVIKAEGRDAWMGLMMPVNRV